MASPIIQIINSAVLTASAALLYTSTGLWTQVMKMTVSNIDTVPRTVTFYLVPSGGSATAANEITIDQIIQGASIFNDPNMYGQVLNPGDSIWGKASTASIATVFASGMTFTN